MHIKAIENYRPFQNYRIMKSKWKSDIFLPPISGDSLKSMKQNEIIVIHSQKTIEIVYFLVTFYNFLQLSVKLLVCGYYGAFQTLQTAIRTCKDVFPVYITNVKKISRKKK